MDLSGDGNKKDLLSGPGQMGMRICGIKLGGRCRGVTERGSWKGGHLGVR